MAWINPITDRTALDVSNRTEKGFINYDDLNRIEGNVDYICNDLNIINIPKVWTRTDFPTPSHMQRILNKAILIRDNFSAIGTIPSVPKEPMNIYFKFNALETVLKDSYILIEGNKENKIYTGEAYAGDNIGVM